MFKHATRLTLLVSMILFFSTCSFGGSEVDFKALSKARFSRGKVYTVKGNIEEPINGLRLAQVMNVTRGKVTYEGMPAGKGKFSVTNNTWSVSVGPFTGEDVPISFRFVFEGVLSGNYVSGVIDDLFRDPEYRKRLDLFVSRALKKTREVQEEHAEEFVESLGPIISRILSKTKGLNATPKSTFVQAVLRDILRKLPSLVALPKIIEDMQALGVPKVEQGMSPSEAYSAVQELTEQQVSALADETGEKHQTFLRVFEEVRAIFRQSITAEFEASATASEEAMIKDFEKYVGLDFGAIYIPRIDELRSFATANIYFGPVEDSPAPVTATTRKAKATQFIRQRLSLTFGISIGDLSSGEKSKIKGDNAFLYGVGFRLNKYFRLVTGGAIFRSSIDNELRNEFFIGPSVDVTAFRQIGRIFGK